MPARRVITVTLALGAEADQPCTVSCPALALSTDGPTVAAALNALARAIDYLPPGSLPQSDDLRRLPQAVAAPRLSRVVLVPRPLATLRALSRLNTAS